MAEMFENVGDTGRSIAPGASVAIDARSADWQPCGADGFWIKPLLEDETAGIRTWLMKVEAGAYSALHAHDEIEQIYVLEGSFYDQDKTYGAGSYLVRDAGALHSAGSEDGAVMLLFYSPATTTT